MRYYLTELDVDALFTDNPIVSRDRSLHARG
jgi:hypothetical protein